jgi:hypothetical protein
LPVFGNFGRAFIARLQFGGEPAEAIFHRFRWGKLGFRPKVEVAGLSGDHSCLLVQVREGLGK